MSASLRTSTSQTQWSQPPHSDPDIVEPQMAWGDAARSTGLVSTDRQTSADASVSLSNLMERSYKELLQAAGAEPDSLRRTLSAIDSLLTAHTGRDAPPTSLHAGSTPSELLASLDLPHWLLALSEALQTVAMEWAGQLRAQAVCLLENCVRLLAVSGEGGANEVITVVYRSCLLMAVEQDPQCTVKVHM